MQNIDLGHDRPSKYHEVTGTTKKLQKYQVQRKVEKRRNGKVFRYGRRISNRRFSKKTGNRRRPLGAQKNGTARNGRAAEPKKNGIRRPGRGLNPEKRNGTNGGAVEPKKNGIRRPGRGLDPEKRNGTERNGRSRNREKRNGTAAVTATVCTPAP